MYFTITSFCLVGFICIATIVTYVLNHSFGIVKTTNTVIIPDTVTSYTNSLLDTISTTVSSFGIASNGFLVAESSVATTVERNANSLMMLYTNKFAEKFYPLFSPKNIFSPVSFAFSLSTLYYGSTNTSNNEFQNLLGGGNSLEELMEIRNSYGFNRSHNVRMTTYLSINSSLQIKESYKDIAKDLIIISSDNYGDANNVISRINKFFLNATNGILTTAAKSIRPQSTAVLFDTLLFSAPWKSMFNEEESKSIEFKQATGNIRPVKAVRQDLAVDFYEDSEVQHLEIPFSPANFVFGIILPVKSLSPGPLNLDIARISGRITRMKTNTIVSLTLPKIRMKRMIRAVGVLSKLGLRTPFHAQTAHFSNIADKFFLTDIIHEGFLHIDEYGANSLPQWRKTVLSAKSAAIKAARLRSKSTNTSTIPESKDKPVSVSVDKTITLDRQFMYYVRDKATESFLLVGDFDG